MTSRPHHITFAVGLTIVVVVTLLYLLHKTHTHLQDVQTKLIQTQIQYTGLSRQFDSLFEYKERLEKAFITLKTKTERPDRVPRPLFLNVDEGAKEELSRLKSNYALQLQLLQDDLATCRKVISDHDELAPASSANTGGGGRESSSRNRIRSSSPSVPLLAPLSLARERDSGNPMSPDSGSGTASNNLNTDNFKGKLSSSNSNTHKNKLGLMEGLKDGKEKEAIQSPIGHVPVHPGQPSGDPNEDTAGNVLI